MANADATLQYLSWALVPLCRECHPDCKTVTIRVDLIHGQTITSYEKADEPALAAPVSKKARK
jgi:hypothetical protein